MDSFQISQPLIVPTNSRISKKNRILSRLICTVSNDQKYCSDTSSINHLVMRESVSGPPRYHLAIKMVCEQFVILDQNRVSFVHLRVFTTVNEIAVFNVYFLDRQLCIALKDRHDW